MRKSVNVTMKFLVSIGCLGLYLNALAHDKQFEGELLPILEREMVAANFDDVHQVAQDLLAVSEKYPDEWLGWYWTAFVYSQCGVFARDERFGPFVDKALVYFEKATQNNPKPNARDASELHILQALLYALKSANYRYQHDAANVEKYEKLEAEYIEKARKAFPKNPRVHMMKATDKWNNKETREESFPDLYAALDRYDAYELATPISPNWGKSFIVYRLRASGKK